MMNGGSDWGGWIVGSVVMVALLGLVFWAIVSVVRRPSGATPRARTAEEILEDRFARGEIDVDEYEQRSRALQTR